MTINTTYARAAGGDGRADMLTFSGDWLTAQHVDSVFRVYDSAANVYRYCVLKEIITTRQVRVAWDRDPLPLNASSNLWEEMAISGARGYFRSVCLYQQRLVFGGTRDAGSLLLLSKAGQFRNFDLGSGKDADAIAVIETGAVRNIQHVVAGPQLSIFTDDGVSIVEVDAIKALTPTAIRLRKISPYGAANAPPGEFDGGVLMVTAGGVSVRDVSYSSDQLNVAAAPVSLAASGFLGSIVDSAYLSGTNARPEQIAFFVTSDGRIVLFHSVREQKIGAWFEWTTFGAWTSVAVAGQKLFAVAQRNGTYRLEVFDFDLPFDACTNYGPQSATTPIPCGHLQPGVYAHAIDSAGDYLGTGVVTGTGVTVERQTGDLPDLGTGSGVVGMAYGWWIDPMPPAVDLPDGSIIERYQRQTTTSLLLQGAQSVRVEADSLVLLNDAVTDAAVPAPVARWWRVRHLGWSRPNGDSAPASRRITRNLPLPVTVLALLREIKV